MHGRLIPVFIGLLVMTASCQQSVSVSIIPADVQLRPGDVVFRRGCGALSYAVLRADSKGIYTHTGIVVDSCGVLFIVHAVPGEPDYDGDPDRVKMDSPETFFCSDRAVCGEVRRIANSSIATHAASVAMKVYNRHTLFDHNYDYHDTTTMYCTELIVHAYSLTGNDLCVTPSVTPFPLPAINVDSIFMPSDILDSKQLKLVARF